jgi:hypothetical protein
MEYIGLVNVVTLHVRIEKVANQTQMLQEMVAVPMFLIYAQMAFVMQIAASAAMEIA